MVLVVFQTPLVVLEHRDQIQYLTPLLLLVVDLVLMGGVAPELEVEEVAALVAVAVIPIPAALVTLQPHPLMVAMAHLPLQGKEITEEHGPGQTQMMLVLAGVEQVKQALDIQLAQMRVGQAATDNLRLFLV